MYDMEDIMGCTVDKCKNVPSEGLASFMKRAVDKADGIYRKVRSCTFVLSCFLCTYIALQAIAGGAASVASTGERGDTVTDLVRAVRDEDIKVHINIEDAVHVSRLAELGRGLRDFALCAENHTWEVAFHAVPGIRSN